MIIGSAKAGTTSLAGWLSTHPRIHLGHEKEPRFFSDLHKQKWTGPGAHHFSTSIRQDATAYKANFPPLTEDSWALDASVDYIWCDGSLERIREFSQIRRVKLIAVIRDPIERAVSEYNHTLRHGWEKNSFLESLDLEEERVRRGFTPLFMHSRRSRVYDDIVRARRLFGEDLYILDYTDLKTPIETMSRITSFLGLEGDFSIDSKRRNESYLPRNGVAKWVLQNTGLRKMARHLLPPRVRHAAWKNLHAPASKVATVALHEKVVLRDRLREEIEACVTSGFIPTRNWSCLSLGSGRIVSECGKVAN